MGLTKVTVKVQNLTKSGKPYEALFLVDTGAINCLAPEKALKNAGIKTVGKTVYELANGQLVELEYGYAIVSFMGSETVTQIFFGPANAEPLLGIVAMENVGIMVDPVSNELKKLAAIPLK